MARIAVGGFQHETNSFVAHRADFDYFAVRRDRPPLVRGARLIESLAGGSYAMSGFLAGTGTRHELLPLVWASGGAGGPVTDDAFERIAGELIGRLSIGLPVDAVYLDLHGAMVTPAFEDAEGELLRRVRAAVGEGTPVVASLDYHANVTPQMVELTDGLVAYLTYPHVDRPQTGERAARIVEALLVRGRPGGRALRKLPFLIPADFQCTLVEPSRGVVDASIVDDGTLVDLTYAAGFPPSDLQWCGPAVVAHAWNQRDADRAADALASRIAAQEGSFAATMWPLEDGVREAPRPAAHAPTPVGAAHPHATPGAGARAATTGVLRALLDAGAEDAMIGFLCDPQAAQAAHRAGEGAEIEVALGGHSGPAGVVPVRETYRVLRLGDGRFVTSGSVAGGMPADLGPMALLRCRGVGIVVTSRRMQAYDPAPFTHLGVDPAAQKILVLKSTCHFRADFEPLAQAVLTVLAPGGYRADPAEYPYRRLRDGVRLRPLGPAWSAGRRSRT